MKKLRQEEGPIKVQNALVRDFPNLKSESWFVIFEEEVDRNNCKSTFTVDHYAYRERNDARERYEVDCDTEGNLEQSKRISKS